MITDKKPYCIAVYSVGNSNHYVVRKCCDPGYTWHSLETFALEPLPQCSCEIVGTNLSKVDALQMGKELSEKYGVSLVID